MARFIAAPLQHREHRVAQSATEYKLIDLREKKSPTIIDEITVGLLIKES